MGKDSASAKPCRRDADLLGGADFRYPDCMSSLAFLFWIAALAAPASGDAETLAGLYDGGETEIAAMLELGVDGRFRYALRYGALDEEAAGNWTLDGDRLFLTSDPVAAPRIRFDRHEPGPVGGDAIAVTLDAGGLPPQLFTLALEHAVGRMAGTRLDDGETRLSLGGNDPPQTMTLTLPLFDIVGDRVPIAGKAGRYAFRFEPNDLGKVAFAATPLQREGEDLRLERHGRMLRFRRAR